MTTCPVCGHENPERTTVCAACGQEAVAETPRPGRFFTRLSCTLMFGVPVTAIGAILALSWYDARIGLPEAVTDSARLLASMSAGAISAGGGAAGWFVATYRWCGSVLVAALAIVPGFLFGLAIYAGSLFAVSLLNL